MSQLKEKHVREVCELGHGELTCAFLTVSAQGFECAKGGPFERPIRIRLAKREINARGDNCTGPPYYFEMPHKIPMNE